MSLGFPVHFNHVQSCYYCKIFYNEAQNILICMLSMKIITIIMLNLKKQQTFEYLTLIVVGMNVGI